MLSLVRGTPLLTWPGLLMPLVARLLALSAVVAGTLLPPAWSAASLPPLHADGLNIINASGRPVALRGTNLGGAFVYEQWMVQVPGPPAALDLWALLDKRFGRDRRRQLQRLWQENWIGEDDIAACAAMGMTCVRLPFGYWVLEEPDRPGQWREDGFAQLRRVVDACARHGLYVILDLHGVPGGQSESQCCGVVGKNEFWASDANIARAERLWREIARRFRDYPNVAGYDLLNEPSGAPSRDALLAVYDRLYRAVREVDDRHIVMLEDAFFGLRILPPPAQRGWSNVVYSIHFYPFGYHTDAQHEALLRRLRAEARYQRQRLGVPVVVGEFSAVSMQNGGPRWYRRYIEQLNALGWGWLTWCWKHPCTTPSEDLWGIRNQPASGRWRPPDFYRDTFEELAKRFKTFALEHWRPSPIVAPLVADGLSAPFQFPAGIDSGRAD